MCAFAAVTQNARSPRVLPGSGSCLTGTCHSPAGCWGHGAHGAAASPGGPHSSFMRSWVSTRGQEQPDPIEVTLASGSGVGTSEEGPFYPRWFDDSMILVLGCTQHCRGSLVASSLHPSRVTQPTPPRLAVSLRVTQIKLHVMQLHARFQPAAVALVMCWCCTWGQSLCMRTSTCSPRVVSGAFCEVEK